MAGLDDVHHNASDETSDMELLGRWQAGDSTSGQALVARHFAAVARFFRTKLGDDCGDLIQQTFLECSTHKASIQTSFRGFLFTIARARLFDSMRRRYAHGVTESITEQSLENLGCTPPTQLARNQTQTRLLQALTRLPLDMRILLELTYWENMAAPEVSAILGIPANTVRGSLSRARALLRDELGGSEEESVVTLSEFSTGT